MTRGYREDIDWLRAIAVMAVIALFFAQRIPTRQPGDVDEVRPEA